MSLPDHQDLVLSGINLRFSPCSLILTPCVTPPLIKALPSSVGYYSSDVMDNDVFSTNHNLAKILKLYFTGLKLYSTGFSLLSEATQLHPNVFLGVSLPSGRCFDNCQSTGSMNLVFGSSQSIICLMTVGDCLSFFLQLAQLTLPQKLSSPCSSNSGIILPTTYHRSSYNQYQTELHPSLFLSQLQLLISSVISNGMALPNSFSGRSIRLVNQERPVLCKTELPGYVICHSPCSLILRPHSPHSALIHRLLIQQSLNHPVYTTVVSPSNVSVITHSLSATKLLNTANPRGTDLFIHHPTISASTCVDLSDQGSSPIGSSTYTAIATNSLNSSFSLTSLPVSSSYP